MRIPDEILLEYNKKAPPIFQKTVLHKLHHERTNKKEAEKNLKDYYQNKTLPIRWFNDLTELQNYVDNNDLGEIDFIVSYSNINLIYFYYSMMKILNNNKDEVSEYLLDINNKNVQKTFNLYKILLECLGVAPVYKDGLLVEVICVEKPINNSTCCDGTLHNTEGPSVTIGESKIYSLFGHVLDKECWGRTLKTLGYTSDQERYSTSDILTLEPIGLRTKIIEEIGYEALHL